MAEVWDVTNAEYHTDNTKVGSSMLKCVLESPAKYYGQYVGVRPDGSPLIEKKPQTPDQLLGSLVHCLALEPQAFDILYAIRPAVDGRTKAGKEALAKWRAKSLGKEEVTPELRAKASRIAAAVLEDRNVRELMDGAIMERAIVWEEGGRTYKCKPDLFIERPDQNADLHLDLKTSADPLPKNWLSTNQWGPVRKFGYDLQVAAHYPIGIEALTGRPCCSGVIVVGTGYADVFIYDTGTWRACGEAWRARAIAWLDACEESGNWEHPLQSGVVQLPEPDAWSFPQ
jgi:hypothetical protein